MTLEKAKEIMFGQKFHCSQCVMHHTAEVCGMDRNLALRATSGLGGGCMHSEVCGTVSSAVMALGLVYGFDQPNSAEANAKLVKKVGEFEKRFIEKNGTLLCRELLGGAFMDPVNPLKMEEVCPGMVDGTFNDMEVAMNMEKKCPQFCVDACEILDDIIKDDIK